MSAYRKLQLGETQRKCYSLPSDIMILNDYSACCSIQSQLKNMKRELRVSIPPQSEQLVEKIMTDMHVVNSERRPREQILEAPLRHIVFVMYIVTICVVSSRKTPQ